MYAIAVKNETKKGRSGGERPFFDCFICYWRIGVKRSLLFFARPA